MTEQLDVVVSDHLYYNYKAWTHPDHRRRHLANDRGRVRRQEKVIPRDKRLVTYVDVNNYPSRLHRPEQHPIFLGHAGYIRLFGYEIPFTGPTPKRFGFSIVRRC